MVFAESFCNAFVSQASYAEGWYQLYIFSAISFTLILVSLARFCVEPKTKFFAVVTL